MSRSLAVLLTAAALAAVAVACNGAKDPTPQEAVVLIDRELPDGGVVFEPAAFVGTEQPESFQVFNQGRATLTITAASVKLTDGTTPPASFVLTQPIVGVDAGASSTSGDPLPVKVGGKGSLPGGDTPSAVVLVYFKPKAPGRTNALLVVDSDAPARPHVTVPFSVCAVQADGGGC